MSDKRKKHGIHYTPLELAQFLARRAVTCLPQRSGMVRVLDPACGDGELLLAARDALVRSGRHDFTLTGFDLDADAIATANERFAASGVISRLETSDFLDSQKGEFDLIITNPPYVRTQVLGSSVATALAVKYGLRGRVDLAHAFVAATPSWLTSGGVLALLCSNRFLNTRAGGNIRRLLTEQFSVCEVYDLGDTKLFEAAVLPAIVVAKRARTLGQKARFASAYELLNEVSSAEDTRDRSAVDWASLAAATASNGDSRAVAPDHDQSMIYEALSSDSTSIVTSKARSYEVTIGHLESDLDSRRPWRLVSDDNELWIEKLKANTWQTFGDVAKIRVGIKTTADAVFIRNDWSTLPSDLRPEPSLLLPLLTHRNLEQWRPPESPSTKVLYPYDLTSARRRVLDMNQFPCAMAYLENHRTRLASRKYVVDGGREWFEIWVPQKPANWSHQKIVFPDISDYPRFAIDTSGAVVNGDCYWIDTSELPHPELAYLMLGVANSSLALRYYDLICGNKLYAGRRRWITQYVDRLPLPSPTSDTAIQVAKIAKGFTQLSAPPSPPLVAELDEVVEEAFSISPCSDFSEATLF
jgi:methylase of polypeptide subunit release factors